METNISNYDMLTDQPLPKEFLDILKDASRVKPISTVFETRDYSLFKTIKGNRPVDPQYVEKLKGALEQKDLKIPILVNEKMEVIDGQNRLAARKDLGYPVQFIIGVGYDLEDVILVNINQKPWSADDYLHSYVERGYEHYIEYKHFKNAYGFGHTETRILLSGKRVAFKDISLWQNFKRGSFQVYDLKGASEKAKKLLQMRSYTPEYKKRSFVLCMLFYFENKRYDHKKMLQKLKNNPTAMVKCPDTLGYKKLIQAIYNKGMSPGNRILLDF